MNLTASETVLGVMKYNMDGNNGCKVFLQGKTDDVNENVHGLPPTEMPAPFGIFDLFKKVSLPAKLDLEIEPYRAAKGKQGYRIINFKMPPSKGTQS